MCRKRTSESERGFTLIELLVVISIIILLMALLFPALQKAKKQAQAVACQANLHQWAMVLQQYTAEHDGRWFRTGVEPHDSQWWQTMREPHEDYEHLYLCPAETWALGRRLMSTYQPNSWIHDHQYRADGSSFTARYYWRNVHASRSPGTVPILMDAYTAWQWCVPLPWDEPPPHEAAFVPHMALLCVPHHGSFVNSVFMDWSVRRVGLKQLWTLKWHRQFDTNGPWTKAGGVLPQDWPQWMRGFTDY